MSGHILFVSPIPSHPPDQGNGARILALGKFFQSAGWIVHFLYYRMEGLTEAQQAAMQQCWDQVQTVRCTPKDFASHIGPFALDDWFEESVTEAARALHKRWRFRVVLTNYVWCSGVFEAFGSEVIKLLDTHDVFGDRDKRMLAMGLQPAWYYTSPSEEQRGLSRADIVLAIQDEEAAHFRQYGHPNVRLVGHIVGQRTRHKARRPDQSLRAGYIASGNPLNAQALHQFETAVVRRWRAKGRLSNECAFIVAGAVCQLARETRKPFQILGRVPHTDDFYDNIDLALNPMAGGTGLKIKSVEAIFEGVPLVATKCAMIGLPAMHAAHCLSGADELVDYVLDLALNSGQLSDIRVASVRCATEYGSSVRKSLLELMRELD